MIPTPSNTSMAQSYFFFIQTLMYEEAQFGPLGHLRVKLNIFVA